MKKVASQAIVSRLRKDITKMDNTGSLSHTSALDTTIALSGSNVDYMSAETQSPVCLYIARGNHLITQSYVLKHYQETQTRMLWGLTEPRVQDETALPDVSYVREWYIDLLHWGNISYQVTHTMDSLLREIPPLSVCLWVRNHCQRQDSDAQVCSIKERKTSRFGRNTLICIYSIMTTQCT